MMIKTAPTGAELSSGDAEVEVADILGGFY